MGTLADYLRLFAKLHTDRASGRWSEQTRRQAPHKPLLLLAVLDRFAEGDLSANLIAADPGLGELFTSYWGTIMPPDTRGNLALPFFHLKSDSFWHLIPRPGQEVVLASSRQIRSVAQLHEIILGARLDDELYELLETDQARAQLREVLLTIYFNPAAEAALRGRIIINSQAFDYSRQLLDEAGTHHIKEEAEPADLYLVPARDQGFRRAVVTAYDHRCALCGVRVLTLEGHTAVAAAHIVPWSISHDDDPCNGMALCHLCHWAFDEGLIGVGDSYLVRISPQLGGGENMPGHLQTMARRPIIVPKEQRLWPYQEALQWHLREVFQNR